MTSKNTADSLPGLLSSVLNVLQVITTHPVSSTVSEYFLLFVLFSSLSIVNNYSLKMITAQYVAIQYATGTISIHALWRGV